MRGEYFPYNIPSIKGLENLNQAVKMMIAILLFYTVAAPSPPRTVASGKQPRLGHPLDGADEPVVDWVYLP